MESFKNGIENEKEIIKAINGKSLKDLPDNFDELYTRFLKNEPISHIAKDCKEMSLSTLRLRLFERYELDKGKSVI